MMINRRHRAIQLTMGGIGWPPPMTQTRQKTTVDDGRAGVLGFRGTAWRFHYAITGQVRTRKE